MLKANKFQKIIKYGHIFYPRNINVSKCLTVIICLS